MKEMSHAFLAFPRPAVFAHRGDSVNAPENTMPAFACAVEEGIQVLETDVHWTKDGIIVVSHDSDVSRVSNGRGNISDLTYEELRQLDFGYHYTPDGGQTFPYRNRGVGIVRFQELLEAFPHTRFNVDLKPKNPPSLRKFIEEVYEAKACDRVLAASFHHDNLQKFRMLNRDIATSASPIEIAMLLGRTKLGLSPSAGLPYVALQVPTSMYGVRVITEKFIHTAHSKGVQVHVWTIDEPSEMLRLWSMGVDVVMTNHPKVGLRTLTTYLDSESSHTQPRPTAN